MIRRLRWKIVAINMAMVTAVLLAVVALLLLKKVVRHWTGVTACTLILSGGIGNIIDRIVHGYVVDMDTVDPEVAQIGFVNVNDGTTEGLRYHKKNIMTVQYHPEASPGPHDSGYLFEEFMKMMGGCADAEK